MLAAGKLLQHSRKEPGAFDKISVLTQHHQIDGIEVFLTPKASGQVGFLHGGGLKFATKRTKKAQMSLALLAGDQQFFGDKHIDRYEISQLIKLLGGKPSFHPVTSIYLVFFSESDCGCRIPRLPAYHLKEPLPIKSSLCNQP
jgi:hypothetical protein